ncbi:MAG: hypothetical protein GY724_25915 [Actinomycetia bacterium]|nr:hypothetical protein [Actinomycetes bacterium]MCP4223361.1 hypothetical protein [Actinomycetes bacterium]MCP5032641.1 hypothetical protein [Actinomycetes bacterium]
MTDEIEEAPDTAVGIDSFKALGFFPADHAAAEGGKVYANGAYWTVLRFREFPAVLSGMTLVAVLQQPFHAYLADHTFAMRMQDSDGNNLPAVQVQGQFRATLGPDAKYGDPGVLPFAVPLHGLKFERPGRYAFVFSVDDQELARYPFQVIQILAPKGPGAAGAPS